MMYINIPTAPSTEQEPTDATFIVCHGPDARGGSNINTALSFTSWVPSDSEENTWLMNATDLRMETEKRVAARTCGNDVIGCFNLYLTTLRSHHSQLFISLKRMDSVFKNIFFSRCAGYIYAQH